MPYVDHRRMRIGARAPLGKPAWNAPILRHPPLWEFVVLSMLLHALAIALFGAPSGGSREGHAMWGSLDVVLRGVAREEAPRLRMQRNISPPPIVKPARPVHRAAPHPRPAPPRATRKTPSANVAHVPVAPLQPMPAAPEAPPFVAPLLDRIVIPERALEPAPQVPPPTPNEVPVPIEAPAANAEPAAPALPEPAPAPEPAAPAAPEPPVERTPLETPALPTPEAPPTPPVQAAPLETPALPAPEAPSTPPVQAAPVETPALPAPDATATPPVQRAPVETPSLPVPDLSTNAPATPQEPAAAAAPATTAPAPVAPPAEAEPAPHAVAPAAPPRAAPAPAPAVPAAPPGDSLFKPSEPSGTYDPTAPASPSLDLDAIRRRAGEIAREGSGQRALLAFPMPAVPPAKSAMEKAIDNARKPDCRTAYQSLGLAAVVPLVANEFGEGNCRW